MLHPIFSAASASGNGSSRLTPENSYTWHPQVSFEWQQDVREVNEKLFRGRNIGFIAQEIEEVFPEVVHRWEHTSYYWVQKGPADVTFWYFLFAAFLSISSFSQTETRNLSLNSLSAIGAPGSIISRD